MYTVLLLGLAAAAVPLALRFHRHRVRVGTVRRVRSEISDLNLNALRLGYPETPVGGVPTPRNVPPTGPETPDGTPALDPPTESSLSRRDCAVRPRRRVVLSEPKALSTALLPGWRFQ